MRLRHLFFPLFLFPFVLAGGVSGRGGLETLAVSPDGRILAVGGQNRVVYILDGVTLEVRHRHWIGARIGGLAFDADGGRLVVEDETDRLHLLDTRTGKKFRTVTDCLGMVAHRPSGLLIVRGLGDSAKHLLRFLSVKDLEEVGRAEFPDRPIAWLPDATGKRLLVLGASYTGEERRVPAAEIPRELRGLARWTFRLKHDGQESVLYDVDLPGGKVAGTTKLWYTSDSDTTQLARVGQVTYLFNRVNVCARVAGDGAIKLFETTNGVNHAVGLSASGKVMVLGALGRGSHGPIEGKRIDFALDPLPGQAELFTRFVVHDDGSAWGVTTAYRVVRITKEGKVDRVASVY